MYATRYPPADQSTQWFGNGNATVSPNKIGWHTTESGRSWPSYGGGGSAPNLTYHPWDHVWRQHFPINGTAAAFKNNGDFMTNRAGIVQVEIICYCDQKYSRQYGYAVEEMDDQAYDDLSEFSEFMRVEWGVPPSSSGLQWPPWFDSSKSSPQVPKFASNSAFTAYAGHCGHVHILGNDHADPGGLDVERIMSGSGGGIPVSDVSVSTEPAPEGYHAVEKLSVTTDGRLWAEVADSVIIEPPPTEPPPTEPPPTQPPPSGGGGSDYPVPTSNQVYLDKLHYGQDDSDSVWYLQDVLNGHSLAGGSTLPTTGFYGDQTDHEVILCQQQHGFGNDPAGTSYVGQGQADHLFAGSGLEVIGDTSSGGGGGGSAPPPSGGSVSTPWDGAVVTTAYGVPGSWSAGFHTGEDWACGYKQPVRATWTGKVVAINAWGSSYGQHVISEHSVGGQTVRTAYCHLAEIQCHVGQDTWPGFQLGLADNTGNSTGNHLHVEQRTSPYGYNNHCQKPVM